jgi:hypothetical protein
MRERWPAPAVVAIALQDAVPGLAEGKFELKRVPDSEVKGGLAAIG